ncbi:MAG: hypothetical protein KIS66_07275 [Fimbriimonadaceae bacterium]|nr:hypothetical protein [Fimbriimonadaceae bacterium]
MDDLGSRLRRFVRRVRWMGAWKGAGIGAWVGSGLAVAWSILDWTGVWFATWAGLALLVFGASVLGAVVGFCRRVSVTDLADSIDRRAGLQNRLRTALHHVDGAAEFDEPLLGDAQARLAALHPRRLFPVRVGRLHWSAMGTAMVASAVFLLGGTPLWLGDAARQERDELKLAAAKVERILRPVAKIPEEALTADERALAAEMRRFAEELRRRRLGKEEAMQKANDFAKRAEELARERFKQADKYFEKAESAWRKMEESKLAEAGLQGADPEKMRLSDQELNQAIEQLDAQIAKLKEKLQNPNLSKDERKALEEELEKAQTAKNQFELSKKAKDFLDRVRNHPLYRELRELAEKLRKEAQAGQQGQRGELTREQFEAMRKKLEELADKLKSDEALEQYLREMLEAMKNCEGG